MQFAADHAIKADSQAAQELANAVDMPAGFDYLWAWFMRLHQTRPKGFSIGGIPESEIRSFFLNRNIVPEEWEMNVIERLDSIALTHASENKEGEGET